MFEQILAGAVALVCAALLLRLALGPEKRRRWDRAWRRVFERVRAIGPWVVRNWRRVRSRGAAQRQAEQAIRRARNGRPDVERSGNVIRPRSFRSDDSDQPPTLH